MPELAEVEYYRRQWNCALREKIIRVQLHAEKRIFRDVPVSQLAKRLSGGMLLGSEARGKQLLFRFSKNLWLGLHLGMSGKLRVESPGFRPGRHDHLVLYQRSRALIFTDPRLFGRVRFHEGRTTPDWWSALAPSVGSSGFKRELIRPFLQRHPRLPIKAALLLQSGFPGIGNWMADEILWRAKIHPLIPAGGLVEVELDALWRSLGIVCRGALKYIATDFSDPPRGWLFHERWRAGGRCPVHGTVLSRLSIAGRASAWCDECQSRRSANKELAARKGA